MFINFQQLLTIIIVFQYDNKFCAKYMLTRIDKYILLKRI